MTIWSSNALRFNVAGNSLSLSRQHAALIIILFGALLFRLFDLGGRSLWFDEAYAVVQSRSDDPNVLTGAGTGDPHPPLHYVMLHYWTPSFGESEASVRLPSALISVLSVFLLYLLGKRLFGVQVGLLAAALLAFSPLDIWYAQEARMYAFIVFAGLLMALGLSFENWVGGLLFAFGLGFGLYMGYLVVPLWVGISVIWLLYWWLRGRKRLPFLIWLLASVAGWLAFQPWWSGFRDFLTENLENPFLLAQLRALLNLPEFTPFLFGAALVGAGLLLLLAGIVLLWLVRRESTRRLVTLLAIVCFAAITLSMLSPRLYSVKRVILTGWPFVVLFVAWLLMQLGTRRRSAVWGLVGLSVVVSLYTILFVPKPDWRGATAHVSGQMNAGELAWIDPRWNRALVAYYSPELAHDYGGEQKLMDTAEGLAGLWLIAERYPGHLLPTSPTEAWLDANWELVSTRPFYQVEVRHYQRP